jgi:hypothetical protein
MRELTIVALISSLLYLSVIYFIPSREIYVGENMGYETNLGQQVKQEMELLREQNGWIINLK